MKNDVILQLCLNTPKLFDKTPDKGISILLATQLKAGKTDILKTMDETVMGSCFIYHLAGLKASLISYELLKYKMSNFTIDIAKEILSYSSPRALLYIENILKLFQELASENHKNGYNTKSLLTLFSPFLCRPVVKSKEDSFSLAKEDIELFLSFVMEHLNEIFPEKEKSTIKRSKYDEAILNTINNILDGGNKDNDNILPPSNILLYYRSRDRKCSELKDYTEVQDDLYKKISNYEKLYKEEYGVKPSEKERIPVDDIYHEYEQITSQIYKKAANQIQSFYKHYSYKSKSKLSASLPKYSILSISPDLPASLLSKLTDNQLSDLKRITKTNLVQFDKQFYVENHRKPNLQEKSRIMSDYNNYNIIKSKLNKNKNDQKLRVLKEEKREIKNKILTFENKFFEENKRRIKFKGDIIGYEDLYQQYFEIKKKIIDEIDNSIEL